MKTPFTPYFKLASLSLTQVSRQPFVPSHPMPFVAGETTAFYVGDGCQLCYRWHDGFDVFVAMLEACLSDVNGSLDIPVASHLRDLHLVYQLAGYSTFRPPATSAAPALQLPSSHHLIVNTPPATATLHFRPDQHTRRFTIAVIVPKSKWLARHSGDGHNPLEELFDFRNHQPREHRYLAPAPISPQVQVWLHLLLNVPRYAGLVMDDALNHPVAHLVEQHRTEYNPTKHVKKDQSLIAAARSLARELVALMDGQGAPPRIEQIATALHTTNPRLRRLHLMYHGQRFIHYIYKCRLEEAKQRLRRNLSIATVAHQLGWSEHANFSNEFKHYTGMSPTEYRRRYGGD